MQEQLENIIGVLAHTRLHPQMYAGSTNIEAIQGFLSGFYFASSFTGLRINETENQIAKERGWTLSSGGLIAAMKERNLSERDRTTELFTILILALVRAYNLSTEAILNEHNRMREYVTDKYQLKIMSDLEKDLGIS